MEILKPVDPLSFQVAWESTLKCNMDCSYCGDGHDNTQSHPSLAESLHTVDFIFDYLELQMQNRTHRIAGLNIQGGESVNHPKIVQIMEYIQEKKKAVDYSLSVALITNATSVATRWARIVDLVDYFTVSFHAELNVKNKSRFLINVLYLKEQNKNFQVNIMMHPHHWQKCITMIEFCKKHKIQYHLRQIDHHWFDRRFNYTAEQVEFLTGSRPVSLKEKTIAVVKSGFDLDAQGRSCCGGNSMCADGCSVTRVTNRFKGWHCSVDKYFLYIRQTTGEVFTNKDCKMNWDGDVGPIGNLKDTQQILNRLQQGTPTIVCKKSKCWCGLCAPKAATAEKFNSINHMYATEAMLQLKDQ